MTQEEKRVYRQSILEEVEAVINEIDAFDISSISVPLLVISRGKALEAIKKLKDK